jgi:hypothetical protein
MWYFDNGKDYFAIENFIENKRNEHIAKNIMNGYLTKIKIKIKNRRFRCPKV